MAFPHYLEDAHSTFEMIFIFKVSISTYKWSFPKHCRTPIYTFKWTSVQEQSFQRVNGDFALHQHDAIARVWKPEWMMSFLEISATSCPKSQNVVDIVTCRHVKLPPVLPWEKYRSDCWKTWDVQIPSFHGQGGTSAAKNICSCRHRRLTTELHFRMFLWQTAVLELEVYLKKAILYESPCSY